MFCISQVWARKGFPILIIFSKEYWWITVLCVGVIVILCCGISCLENCSETLRENKTFREMFIEIEEPANTESRFCENEVKGFLE